MNNIVSANEEVKVKIADVMCDFWTAKNCTAPIEVASNFCSRAAGKTAGGLYFFIFWGRGICLPLWTNVSIYLSAIVYFYTC